jgi:hypothetical protein
MHESLFFYPLIILHFFCRGETSTVCDESVGDDSSIGRNSVQELELNDDDAIFNATELLEGNGYPRDHLLSPEIQKSVKEITKEYQQNLKISTEIGKKNKELMEVHSRPNSVKNFIEKIQDSELGVSNNSPVSRSSLNSNLSDNLNSRSSGVNLMKKIIESKCIDSIHESLNQKNEAKLDVNSSSSGKYNMHADKVKLNAQNDSINDILNTRKIDKLVVLTEFSYDKPNSTQGIAPLDQVESVRDIIGKWGAKAVEVPHTSKLSPLIPSKFSDGKIEVKETGKKAHVFDDIQKNDCGEVYVNGVGKFKNVSPKTTPVKSRLSRGLVAQRILEREELANKNAMGGLPSVESNSSVQRLAGR